MTDKLYKDYILTGFNTIDKDGENKTIDVTDLLNQYAGPEGDFFKDNEYVLNDPEKLFSYQVEKYNLYYMDYKGNEFTS